MKKIRLLITALLLILFLPIDAQDSLQQNPRVKYAFLFIGDGMGLAQLNLTQAYLAATRGEMGFDPLTFTRFPHTGFITTHSASNLSTCSSAAGTALATGKKTSNGRVSLSPGGDTVYQTIAEKAHEAGMKIGIVTSVSIDHATPASFYAHNTRRNNYFEIAMDLVGSGFEYFAGGGFLEPDGKLNGRPANVFTEADKNGYTLVGNLQDFKSFLASGKVIVLSPVQGADASMPFRLGSNPADLSLADFTAKGIRHINNPAGFFMMVEGGKIDWACHANDGATMVHEIMAFDDAIKEAVEVYKMFPEETVIIVTADHETGGLSLGNTSSEGGFDPSLLAGQRISPESTSNIIQGYRKKSAGDRKEDFDRFMGLLTHEFGLNDGSESTTLSSEEVARLEDSFNTSMNSTSDNNQVVLTAIRILNEKAGLGWGTSDHTAIAVPVFAIGAGAERFSGFHDNTDIPKILEELMGLDR